MAKIGFIGLGIMGDPVCRNLIRTGNDVTVCNRAKEIHGLTSSWGRGPGS